MNWEPYRLHHLAFALGGPVMSAVLRAAPEDFQVDELLGFEPAGAGDHLFLHIRKRNQNTAWVAERLARLAGVKPMDVSYSGLKDRRAVTTQWFSLLWPRAELPDFSELWTDEVQLLAQTRNNRKLRRGAHQANRFGITLRQVSGERAGIEARLRDIVARGVPNYFGEQRFGLEGGNLAAGEQLLRERLADPRRRRDDRREGILISALRSALFNRVLSARVAGGSWDRALPGDVLNLDGRGSFFTPGADDPDPGPRLRALELHPTGPLHGRGWPVVSGEVAALEATLAEEAPEIVQGLEALGLEAQRRALRLAVRELSWGWPEHDSLRLEWVLTSGAYATAVLRELAVLEAGGQEIPVE